MYDKASLIALCVSIFVNAYGMTFLFSFVGLYVVELDLASDRNEAGYYAGYITSAFMFGRTISSLYWGWFADRFGRRPVILIGLASIAILSAPFGITTSLFGAISVRFGSGFMNGIVATAKTMTSEMCSDEDAAFCMGLVTGLWSLGLITGPAVSGWLSYPAVNFPNWFSMNGLFGKYPFLLPCLISALFGWIGLTAAWWYLKETLSIVAQMWWCPVSQSRVDYQAISSELDTEIEMTDITRDSQQTETADDDKLEMVNDVEPQTKIFTKNVVISVTTYCLYSFTAIFMDEVVPLWALAAQTVGGLEMHVDQIGTILAVGGFCILLYQFGIYPLISNRFTMKVQFVAGCAISGLFSGLIPYMIQDTSSSFWFWLSFVLINGTRVSAQVTTFTAISVMCNNACLTKNRGRINGFTMGCASFFKMLGPVAGSILFAWSIHENENTSSTTFNSTQVFHHNPSRVGVDVHFTFVFAMILNLALALAGTRLPDELNHKIDE